MVFDDVRVPRANLIGALNQGGPIIERMLDRATALLCAQMLGAASKDAEMAIEYAKYREAFGQPIGAFQSIQHICADMIIWIDGGELLTYEALWKMDQGLPAQRRGVPGQGVLQREVRGGGAATRRASTAASAS